MQRLIETLRVKGEGDATAAAIYANAFKKDPEFYSFYKSMGAYRETFNNKSDILIVEPEAPFFKHMR